MLTLAARRFGQLIKRTAKCFNTLLKTHFNMSKEIEKQWTNLIKTRSKENDWKFKEYFIFKIDGQFLFDSMFWINGKTNSLKGVLHFKFAEIDDLFWKLTVDHDAIENHPLSLRVNGSHMVSSISYYNFELLDVTEVSLTDLLKTIDSKVAEIKEKFLTDENYLDYIRKNKVLNEHSYLTNLLFCKKFDELLLFIEHCKKNNITSGMSISKNGISEDYFDRITNYIHLVSHNNKLTPWNDYWKMFDLLIDKLKRGDHGQIIRELKDAQKYVNGLTDGWHDFKIAMERTLESNKSKMTSEQVDIANNLIETLNYSLTNRG